MARHHDWPQNGSGNMLVVSFALFDASLRGRRPFLVSKTVCDVSHDLAIIVRYETDGATMTAPKFEYVAPRPTVVPKFKNQT
jgi:hypothetical protein